MMPANMRAPLEWIATQQQHMVFLTQAWSRINSGSYHREGIRKFRRALEDNFRWLEGEMTVIPLAPITQIDSQGNEISVEMAEALTIRKRPNAPIQLLLMGHMDTVYAADHPFQEPVFLEENILNGPGVADLKGGLVVMLKALEAFERFEHKDQLGWQVLLNPDEEIGSVASDPVMKQAAQGKHLGLIYEPALANGSLAGARKGSGNFTLVIHGKSAHAGRNPEEGRNAIVACAELTRQLFALNNEREGLTLNPGRVEGGGALNTVPDLAVLRFNIRTRHAEDEAWILEKITEIIDELRLRNGFDAQLHGQFTRAPKPMTPANAWLFDAVQACARDLGMAPLAIKPSGGCCDGNNLWRHGLPNVDTLGVRGANIHSPQEIMYTDSLTERAQLSAYLLMQLAAGALPLATMPPTR